MAGRPRVEFLEPADSSTQLLGAHEERSCSQVEGELVEIHIAGDRADLGSEAGNLIGEHAWRRNLNGIVPVVVVVAKSIGEVQDCHLGDL